MKGSSRFSLALFILLALLVFASACKRPDIKVPLSIKGAPGIGSLHFEIIYDPTQYSALSVEKGKAFADTLLEYDVASPGHVVVGVISSGGIRGDGMLATVTLQTKKGGPGPLDIVNVVANSASDLADVPVNVSPGDVKGSAPAAPVIEFLPQAE
jgi:hypothetical protein